jgi:UDP-N-acetylmuramate dehydrogenase
MTNIPENISLRPYNTFGIQVNARYFAPFTSPDELAGLLVFARDRKLAPSSGSPSLLILGGGSNILFTRDIHGLVLFNRVQGIDVVREDENHVYIKAGAGENWNDFVQFCLARNLAGVENLSLIPGSVGAAPMQNIGAYGVEVKEVFHDLEAWSLDDGKVYTFTLHDCRFGYRESVFKTTGKGKFIILSVTFRLNKAPLFHTEYGAIREELDKMGVHQLSIQSISEAVIRIRSSKLPDPKQIGNAGSFFKNPVVSADRFAVLKSQFPDIIGFPDSRGEAKPGSKPGAAKPSPAQGGTKLAAGWLIEQCGWKGYRRGDAGCHDRQALVLVNYGNATGREIYELSEEIRQSVKKKFGVELEREVNIHGF